MWRLQTMVHVEDMRSSLGFYGQLGAEVVFGNPDGDYAELRVDGAPLTLLAHPPNPDQDEGRVELNFETDEGLEDVEKRLVAQGVTVVAPATDTGWGRQLQVSAPDGLLIKINQIDRPDS